MLETKVIEYAGETSVIQIKGRYDLSSVSHVEKTFRKQLEHGFSTIGFDLSQTSYIDSSGIGSLIRCINIARKSDAVCVFFDLNNDILTVFKLAKLDSFLHIISGKDFKDQFIDKKTASS